MGRAIVTASPASQNAFPRPAGQASPKAASETAEKGDSYKERLFKYIPAEVVTLYLGLSVLVQSAANAPPAIEWMIFIVCLIGTPFYLWRMQDVTAPLQLIISTIAFAIWIFALGGPFKQLEWYRPLYGALLLPIFTFFVAGIAPRPSRPSTG